MRKSSGGVCGSDEVKGSLCSGISECDESISEGAEAIGYSIVDIAVEVGRAYESMDNLRAAHIK
jgi:hypothetical protein